jgi:hypothetical protein
MPEPTFDHKRLAEYRLSTDYVTFSSQIARSFKGVNLQAWDQWLLVSMLTRLIQRTTGGSEDRNEYEYRDAE